MERDPASYSGFVTQKDEHVLAAALACGAPFLVTLDRPLAEGVNRASLGIRAVTPGEFIQEALPTHCDFLTMR